MKLLETKAQKNYRYKIYEISTNKRMYVLEVFDIFTFKDLKRYYNSNGFVVKKVYINENNTAFKMIMYKGSIWTHGRTQYIKD